MGSWGPEGERVVSRGGQVTQEWETDQANQGETLHACCNVLAVKCEGFGGVFVTKQVHVTDLSSYDPADAS